MAADIEIVKAKGQALKIDRDSVFKQVKCDEENPLYGEFLEEYEKLLPQVLSVLEPKAALGFAPYPEGFNGAIKPGTLVLYMIVTVGKEICDMVTRYFNSGDYVKGMLTDAMASAAVFSFERPVFERLRDMCASKHLGIKMRFEAPGHIPMEIQKTAYEELDAGKTLGLSISSGYMYDPVKSSCQVFETTDNERVLHLTHNCANCSNTDCPYRTESVIVSIADEKGDYELSASPGSNLLELLQENRIPLSAICGGSGRCGKCAVKLLEGDLKISGSDRRFFSEEELAGGMRLACTAAVTGNCRIETVQPSEDNMVSLGPESKQGGNTDSGKRTEKTGIAIDIGTTTLALSLTDTESGEILDTYTAINHQRSLGADVITRIEAAGKGKADKLRELICTDLLRGIQTLLENNPIIPDALQMIAVAGNTTMLHLLMGYPAEGLGVYPFTPFKTELEDRKLGEVLSAAKDLPGELKEIKTVLLPGNSAFAGADIVSGLFSCGFHESEKICALIDLGTNGEMAIGNKDRLMVTSTAAGPAFEGGNIKWGVGSVRGAIARVHIENGTAEIKTIGDTEKAVGICGTGVIEAAAELLRNKLIDES
nr:ASKHA domain-containing protein [Lachnospiraceae bacterium]